MTGYGSGKWETEHWICKVELKSVNHRYLEIKNRLPSEFSNLDNKVKKWVKSKVKRGRIDLYLTIEKTNFVGSKLNTSLLEKYLEALKNLEQKYSISGQIDPIQLLKIPGMLNPNSFELSKEALVKIELGIETAVLSATKDLDKMRTEEGKNLKVEIIGYLAKITQMLNTMDSLLIGVIDMYREKLTNRMKTILEDHQIDSARLLQEAAYYAERSDVSEEMARLRSHQIQCQTLLVSKEEVGKKIDFFMQEMNREATTILAKVTGTKKNRLEITDSAIAIKTEIEKIREQIQNVE